jgi:L-2-hydroxyglutarate oxidase
MAGACRVAVVGGGIIGLASARALLEAGVRPVVVLEAESRIATHQTGHNSGVIHSGLYYKPGSLKAQNCFAGREALYRYCAERGIPHRRSGKIIVATSTSELPRLEELRRRGEANGLDDLRIMERRELHELEPEVDAVAGMRIREAGIVDYRQVALAFRADIDAAGGEVRTGARVVGVGRSDGRHVVETTAGPFEADLVVNCAGLQCDRIARLCGVEPGIAIVPFRGEYYDLAEAARGLVRNPIYPVPDPAFPFLGVHLTPTIGGTVEAGPNAVLALKREGYRKLDLSPRDLAEVLLYPGFRRLAARHWRYGLSEVARSLSKRLFVASVRRLVPRITAQDLLPGKTGVRAQAVSREGLLLDDFHIVHGERSVHVLNAPSPAATSSLSIGIGIARRVQDRLGADLGP